MPQLLCIAMLVLVSLQSALAVPLVPWQSSSDGCLSQCNEPQCASLIAVPFSEVNCAPTGGENDFGTNGDGGTVRDPNHPGTAQPGEIWNNFPNGQPQRENPFGSTGGVIGTVRQPGGINGVQPGQDPYGAPDYSEITSPEFRRLNPFFPEPVTNFDPNSIPDGFFSASRTIGNPPTISSKTLSQTSGMDSLTRP
ncbi:hypothetical protein PCANC_22991 [Puccinia coronata f. sp. avenae]|uniref:Uncharacterized protein n=1 Tax=Puccinia coronata f. sp. avenae TaxID=200324 RepID=A0A2N5U5Q4_9BASI|nr:hypothetical protein PCANC_22991 [Puccinia coronata f. sp. avenae]